MPWPRKKRGEAAADGASTGGGKGLDATSSPSGRSPARVDTFESDIDVATASWQSSRWPAGASAGPDGVEQVRQQRHAATGARGKLSALNARV
jgi:hypothetical protein